MKEEKKTLKEQEKKYSHLTRFEPLRRRLKYCKPDAQPTALSRKILTLWVNYVYIGYKRIGRYIGISMAIFSNARGIFFFQRFVSMQQGVYYM